MRSVPIPGDILRTTVLLGLSFDELVVLGTVPLIVVFPSLFIKQVPMTVSIAIIVIMFIVVLILIAQTPEGQTPVEWAPRAIQRRFSPERYTLKPKHGHRSRPVYLSVIHTADQLKNELSGENRVTTVEEITTKPRTTDTESDTNKDADTESDTVPAME